MKLDVVNRGGDIAQGTQEIIDKTNFKPRQLNNFFNLAEGSGIIRLVPKVGMGGAVLTGLGLATDAKATVDTFKKETPMETTANLFDGIGGAHLVFVLNPTFLTSFWGCFGVMGAASGAVQGWRMNKDANQAADVKQMDPMTRTNMSAGVKATIQIPISFRKNEVTILNLPYEHPRIIKGRF